MGRLLALSGLSVVVFAAVACGTSTSTIGGSPECSDHPSTPVWDSANKVCVQCLVTPDCAAGLICDTPTHTCVSGGGGSGGCASGTTSCGSACVNTQTDPNNCGSCGNACGNGTCSSGTCVSCPTGFLDCDGNPSNGCEHDASAGTCACTPGQVQSCYDGAPSTLGVGVCKGGMQTCLPSGLAWGACEGEVLPGTETCNGGVDDDCDGVPEPADCTCTPGDGVCNGSTSHVCGSDWKTYVDDVCDPLQGQSCDASSGKCSGACSKAALGTSYIGCDYYPTVTANLVDESIFHFAIAVSNSSGQAANVTVTQGASIITTANVPVGGVKVITLPWVSALKGPSSLSVVAFPSSVTVPQGAYRVRSDQPITVYQFNPLEYTDGNGSYSYSNDASLLLPATAWTGTYRAVSRHHFYSSSGFVAVTARDDNTQVTLTANTQVKGGIAGIGTNGNGTVTLNAGDVMEVVTDGPGGASDPSDLTGALVSANKPVQVIGGHQCTYVPDSTGYCDHLEESMLPYETLSNVYVVTAPYIVNGATKVRMVRVVATEDNTTLAYDPPQGGAPSSLNAGQWAEIANSSADFLISANKPILVAETMEGQDAGGGSGDPAMAIAVPKDQYRSTYLFHAPVNYDTNFVNVVAPAGATVMLDGAAISGFTPIGGSGYQVARAQLSNAGTGDHNMSSSVRFGITVYGYGQYTSYWYPGGMDLTRLR